MLAVTPSVEYDSDSSEILNEIIGTDTWGDSDEPGASGTAQEEGKHNPMPSPGDSGSFFTPPTVQPPQPAQHRRGLGAPVKPWAIIFRARCARVVLGCPTYQVPQSGTKELSPALQRWVGDL